MYEEYEKTQQEIASLETDDEYLAVRKERLAMPKGKERSALYEIEEPLRLKSEEAYKKRCELRHQAQKLHECIVDTVETEEDARKALEVFHSISPPLSPDAMAKEMGEIEDWDDWGHEHADSLMADVLVNLGYARAMLYYLELGKWYI